MDVDDPQTTDRRRIIIHSKPFLKEIYREWYRSIKGRIPSGEGLVVELGSGAGFMKECIPEVITADVLAVDGVDLQLPPDGRLPFSDNSLRAIVMTDVLHHISEPRKFFNEAKRVVRPGGAMVMVEPWVTIWSSFIYRHLHSEPFLPEAKEWEFPSQGPLSGANGALPWILFHRDRDRFEREFPEWKISNIEPLMPFVYLLSGGVSMRSLAPAWLYGFFRTCERGLAHLSFRSAMFAVYTLSRTPSVS
jgi:SAM-dependent methyltransferase